MKRLLITFIAMASSASVNAALIDFEGIASPGSYENNISHLYINNFDIYQSHGHVISSTYVNADEPNNYNSHNTDNGTDWLFNDRPVPTSPAEPMYLSQIGGGSFSIQSMDFAASGTTPSLVTLEGTYFAGGTITESIWFTPYFDTYTFSAAWSGLSEISFIGQESQMYDNFVLNEPVVVVPVPAAIWLFGSGLIGLIGFSRNRKA